MAKLETLQARLNTARLKKKQLIQLYESICEHAKSVGRPLTPITTSNRTIKDIKLAAHALLAELQQDAGIFHATAFDGSSYVMVLSAATEPPRDPQIRLVVQLRRRLDRGTNHPCPCARNTPISTGWAPSAVSSETASTPVLQAGATTALPGALPGT